MIYAQPCKGQTAISNETSLWMTCGIKLITCVTPDMSTSFQFERKIKVIPGG